MAKQLIARGVVEKTKDLSLNAYVYLLSDEEKYYVIVRRIEYNNPSISNDILEASRIITEGAIVPGVNRRDDFIIGDSAYGDINRMWVRNKKVAKDNYTSFYGLAFTMDTDFIKT
jgi:hypothetical protein